MSQIQKGTKMQYKTTNTLIGDDWVQEIVVDQFPESFNYRDAWCECPESQRRASPVWNHHSQRYDTVCMTCRKFLVVG
jgi:hypothetical protein